MSPLLPLSTVEPIFGPMRGRRVGLVRSGGTGNCGDLLILHATLQLLDEFHVTHTTVDPWAPGNAELLLLPGGGNYGHPYCPVERDFRSSALATGLPCVLLPQTVYGVEVHPRPLHAVYVRDHVSARLLRGSVLMPDLALCYTPRRQLPVVEADLCESYSTSHEGLWPGRGRDLRNDFSDPLEYLGHIAMHRRVVTDSLHVCIAGLIARRDVTLLPTALHKNRSAWESWLSGLGCKWAESPDTASGMSREYCP